ncbi:MAG TPA: histidine phosphatase family protein [Staphylococcus sp.]|nr:histidine phosphatase family protein [Staphylococcus sp.]
MIYVLRHCKANGQDINAQLTPEGQLTAKQLVPVLAKLHIEHIYVSKMDRTYETIKPFINEYKINITYDSRLNERILSNLPIDNWLTELKMTFSNFEYRVKNGETSSEAQKRILTVYNSITLQQNTLIVTHGNIMTLLLNHFDKQFGFDEWKNLNNPDLYVIDNEQQIKRITLE